MVRAALLALLTIVGGCSCGDEGAALLVDLRTDLVPTVEFQVARVEVFAGTTASGDPARTADSAVLSTYDYFTGRRIAEIESAPEGPVMVRVRLLDAAGEVVAERLVRVDLAGRVLITVLITRDCRNVMCPDAGDSPSAITCLGGRCVDPTCLTGVEPGCSAECSSDASCGTLAACADARCITGVCVAEAHDDRCAAGAYCDPELGCRARPDVDGGGGGDDAGVPTTDGGVDAGCTETSCDDGEACNGVETCVEGRCAPGTPMVCDDGVSCTEDRCAAGTCSFVPEDGDCTAAAGGRCDVTTGCQYPTCTAATCTADPCQTATCMGTTCVRASTCTAGQTCCAGACVTAGCDDGNACTDDSCGGAGCVHAPNTSPCSDGNLCTSGDACSGGMCRGGGMVTCSDGNVCTDDTCMPATGCVFTANGDPCDDGAFCTLTDRCSGGSCGGSGSPCVAPMPSCDEGGDTCFSCRGDGDCPGMDTGAWSGCDYSDVCDESASERRDLTTYRCVTGSCMPMVTPETRGCSRTTDGAECAPTEYGGWGTCDSLGGICETAGNQRRSVITHSCQGGVCDTFMGGEAASCTRMTDGLGCSDGVDCNGFEVCGGGTCQPGSPPCDGACLECNEGSGCVVAGDGTPCGSDGFCASGDCRSCEPCIISDCTTFDGHPGCNDSGTCRECGIVPVQ